MQSKKLHSNISYFSHASIKGVYNDTIYNQDEIKDCLEVILSLSYGNIQMMAECFYNFLDSPLRKKIKDNLIEISDALKSIVI